MGVNSTWHCVCSARIVCNWVVHAVDSIEMLNKSVWTTQIYEIFSLFFCSLCSVVWVDYCGNWADTQAQTIYTCRRCTEPDVSYVVRIHEPPQLISLTWITHDSLCVRPTRKWHTHKSHLSYPYSTLDTHNTTFTINKIQLVAKRLCFFLLHSFVVVFGGSCSSSSVFPLRRCPYCVGRSRQNKNEIVIMLFMSGAQYINNFIFFVSFN